MYFDQLKKLTARSLGPERQAAASHPGSAESAATLRKSRRVSLLIEQEDVRVTNIRPDGGAGSAPLPVLGVHRDGEDGFTLGAEGLEEDLAGVPEKDVLDENALEAHARPRIRVADADSLG